MDRILIVDDDRSIRELLSMHLEERGFGVLSAATGAEGFKLAEESSPSAIILDMRLPDASGIDLIPELRKRAGETPVLMITAHHDMASTILAMKAGAFDYIHKPIDIRALDVAIDRALEVRRLTRGTDFLDVAVETRDGGWELTVKDPGRPLPREQRTKAFVPFTPHRARGTGLGLAVVARIAREHRGEAKFLDTGEGNVIAVTFGG